MRTKGGSPKRKMRPSARVRPKPKGRPRTIDRLLALRVKVVFKKLPKKVYGWVWQEERHIEIDLRKPVNPVRTFFHELIHILYPDKCETAIWRIETRLWARLKDEDIFNLGRKMYNRKFKNRTNEG